MAEPALELRGIRVAHDDAVVVDGLDLVVQPGQTVLLAGPSGCGKSTVLGVCSGAIPHSRAATMWGTVLLDGIDVTLQPPDVRARTIGLLAQDPATSLCLTRGDDELAFAPENLCWPPGETHARVAEVADELGVAHLLGRESAHLSGGQQQRLALAATLAARPSVLLLDEPLSLLDPTSARQVAELLARVQAAPDAPAIVVVEHRLDELRAAGFRTDAVVALAPDPEPEALRRSVRPVPELPAGAVPAEGRPAFVVIDLRRTPDGPVVQPRVELPLAAGAVTAVLGPNGCGKSTVLMALAGLLPHVESPRSDRVGMVFQRPEKQFLATTVAGELHWRSDEAMADELARRVGLDLPDGRSPWDCSVGQQRRLSVVALAAQGHEVLCLDEPTFGLDRASSRQVEQVLVDLADAGRAVVLATHDESLAARIADHVVRLPASGANDPAVSPSPRVRAGSWLAGCNPPVKFVAVLVASMALLATTRVAPALFGWALVTALTPWVASTGMVRVLRAQLPVLGFGLGLVLVNGLSRPAPEGWWIGAGLGCRTFCIAALAAAFALSTDPVRFVRSLHQQARVPSRFAFGLLAGGRLLESLPDQWRDLRNAHLVRNRGQHGRVAWLTVFGRSAFALLVDCLRQGQHLAEAMESRGLGNGPRRARVVERISWCDLWLCLVVAAGLAGAVAASVLVGR